MNLQQYLDTVRTTQFEWGVHDCAMFAAKAVDSLHGTDYASKVREFGATSARKWRARLRNGDNMYLLTRRVLGDPVVCKIEEGDVVLLGEGRRAVLGIAVPPVALIAAEVGFRPIPLAAVTRIWRIT